MEKNEDDSINSAQVSDGPKKERNPHFVKQLQYHNRYRIVSKSFP